MNPLQLTSSSPTINDGEEAEHHRELQRSHRTSLVGVVVVEEAISCRTSTGASPQTPAAPGSATAIDDRRRQGKKEADPATTRPQHPQPTLHPWKGRPADSPPASEENIPATSSCTQLADPTADARARRPRGEEEVANTYSPGAAAAFASPTTPRKTLTSCSPEKTPSSTSS